MFIVIPTWLSFSKSDIIGQLIIVSVCATVDSSKSRPIASLGPLAHTTLVCVINQSSVLKYFAPRFQKLTIVTVLKNTVVQGLFLKYIMLILVRLCWNGIHKCVFVFVYFFIFWLFSYYEEKIGKNVALENSNNFQLKVNFLSPVCFGNYFD